jgi:GNAT-family acetyltransferase (TIGR03103 family)
LNIYAQILIDEAKSRGIKVEIIDEETSVYRLYHQRNSVLCRESLTEKTSAMTMTVCDNKLLTHRILHKAGLRVPHQTLYKHIEQAKKFLQKWESIVIKPVNGEQGYGITVDVRTEEELMQAINLASQYSYDVLLEEFVEGRDLRIIVIDHKFVAAAERKPVFIMGNGKHTIKQLIEQKNKDLKQKTGGESQIPLTNETERIIRQQEFSFENILPKGIKLQVCKTANYHTGGSITDVTEQVSPFLREVAEKASRLLNIPVVGFDFLVPNFNGAEYVIIEANERPGLANHEPQPTAERFIDFLFPETKRK